MNIISLVQESCFILMHFIPSRSLSEVTIAVKDKAQMSGLNYFLWIFDMCKVRRHLLHLFFLCLNKCSERRARCTSVCVCARAHAPWCFQAQLVRPLCFIAGDQTWTVCSLVWISPVNRRSAILFWWRIKTGVQDKPRLCTCVNVTFICRLWLFSGFDCTPLLCLFFLGVWERWCEWAHLCVTAQTVWCCSV